MLQLRNRDGLVRSVARGMQGHFLTASQFAQQYGQPQSNIQALQSYLAGYGIKSTAYADGLDVAATGTAGQFNQALQIHQEDFLRNAIPPRNGHPGTPATRYHATKDSLLLPKNLQGVVECVLGLSNYPLFGSSAVRAPKLAKSVKPGALQLGDLTPADFAARYNMPPGTGAGSTVGIVTLASLDPATAEYFWSNILHIQTKPNRISLVDVDGGSGPVSDASSSGETTLDVEQSGALAPQANIIVYQAPNTDAGFMDAFIAAASDNKADSVSASWGLSETILSLLTKAGIESDTIVDAFDEVYLEMAAQGQTAFTSSGDFGAFTAIGDLGTTDLSADSPADSPWITAAGGTTLPGTIPLTATDSAQIAAERSWGWDWLWPHYADFGFPSEESMAKSFPIGGGGGYSVFEREPDYQLAVNAGHFSAVAYLTPTAFDSTDFAGLTLPTDWLFNPSPSVTLGFNARGRALPDLSTNADPFTGYLLYFTFGDQPATLQAGWGGTSFVAPQLNGVASVFDSLLGHRLGLWNPMLYSFATKSNSPFHPLNTASANNDNLYYTGTPGQVYNPASGLGTPDLTALEQNFAQATH